MDKKLHILHHLYGEADDAAHEHPPDDADLRAEYETLAAVKAALDARPKPRPDAATLDAVLAAAAPTPGARADRPPRRRSLARRYRQLGAVSAVVALLLVVGIGLQQWQRVEPAAEDSAMLAAPKAAEETAGADQDVLNAPAPAEAEAFAARSAAPPAPAADAAPQRRADAATLSAGRAERDAAFADSHDAEEAVFEAEAPLVAPSALADTRLGAAAAADTSVLPAWDEADAVLSVHQRLELLEARSSAIDWDELPAVSLDELPPASARPTSVRPVRQRRDR